MHNRLIGGITFCDSFLNSFNEIFCLTKDIILTKFWFSTYLHYYDDRAAKYDIFNKLNKSQKDELNIKLSDIRFQGAIFYVDRFNFPVSFSNENFISLSGNMWLMNSNIYLNDKSLGPIIIEFDNIQEIAIKDVNINF